MKATGNESRAKMTGAKETGAKATVALDKQDTGGKGDRLMGEKDNILLSVTTGKHLKKQTKRYGRRH